MGAGYRAQGSIQDGKVVADSGQWLGATVGAGLYVALLGLLALAVGALLRHSAGAITTMLGVVLLPLVLALFMIEREAGGPAGRPDRVLPAQRTGLALPHPHVARRSERHRLAAAGHPRGRDRGRRSAGAYATAQQARRLAAHADVSGS